MIAERTLGSVVALLVLSMFGGAAAAQDIAPAVASSYSIPGPDCPYANVYVAVSANDSPKESRLADRVQFAYSSNLIDQGFSIVDSPEKAYWRAFSLVSPRRGVDSSFAWTVYMMATQDLQGKVQTPSNFAGEADLESELSGFMLLRDIPVADLEREARIAATDTAGALVPHAARMCTAWHKRENEDESITQLRDELEQEIQRVRCDRMRKRVTVEMVEPSEQSPGEVPGL